MESEKDPLVNHPGRRLLAARSFNKNIARFMNEALAYSFLLSMPASSSMPLSSTPLTP